MNASLFGEKIPESEQVRTAYSLGQDPTDKKDRQAETPRSYREIWLRDAVYTNSPRAGLGVDRHTLSRISEETGVLSGMW